MSAEVTDKVTEQSLPSLEEMEALLGKRRAHPLLALPSAGEALEMLKGGQDLWGYLARREKLITLATDDVDGDPFGYGFDREYLQHWKDADEDLRGMIEGQSRGGEKVKGQYVPGGKRATKTERAAKRVVQGAMHFERGKVWCFQGSLQTSRAEQQQLIWKYLPREVKALNSKKRHGFAKVNWSQDGGFTENVLVLPNRTEFYFLTYNQDPAEFQGWAIGARTTRQEMREAALKGIFNIGAWMDEDCPWNWLETIEYRCATNEALWLWTFSTINGITTAIKEVLGSPKTVKSRRAELLAESRIHVEGCPAGEMPYVQRAGRPGVSVVYFHADLNPFPPNYEVVKGLCQGKTDAYVMENAYGWSEDTLQRCWPMFSGVHLIDEEELPAEGTNYFFTDPAGNRMWASLWVRVAPGNPGKYFIYRDWPDENRFGAWAIPGKTREEAPDGVAGPAQRSRGYGYVEYRRKWLEEEVVWGGGIVKSEIWNLESGISEAGMGRRWRDPYRRRLVERYLEGRGREQEVTEVTEGEVIREEIYRRYIDPRGGRNKSVANLKGGTCAVDELGKEFRCPRTGEVLAPAMYFEAASGVERAEGLTAINELLMWDKERPFDPTMNAPRLYVVRKCRQVVWALENYTDEGGEDGGCKDFADLLRYMGLARLRYVGGGALKVTGGGSY